MKMLPPPGPERNRLVVMIVALVVIGAAYLKWGGSPKIEIPTTTGPAPTAAPTRVQGPPRAVGGQARRGPQPGADTSLPQPLKLKEMEQVPEEPQPGRNPFRFGEPPPPPKPVYTPPPPPVYTPPPTPTPPPIPPIPLKLTAVVLNRAYLADPRTGYTFEGVEGQIIDGRYKLLKVGTTSVVMSYVDGTGQRTINQGG